MTFRRELQITGFFVGKKKKVLAVMIASMLSCGILEALSVASFYPFFFILQGLKEPEGGSFFMGISDRLIGFIPISDKLIAMSLVVFIIFACAQLSLFLNEVLTSWWRYSLTREVQNELFRKYMYSQYSFFLERKHGEFIYNCFNAPGNASQVWLLIPQFLVAVLKTLGIGVVLLSLEYRFALVLVLLSVMFFFLVRYIARNKSIVYGEARLIAHRSQNELISEAVSGIRQLKAFLLERMWIDKFAKAVNDFVIVAQRDAIVSALPKRLLEAGGVGIICLLVVLMGYYYGEARSHAILPTIGVFAVAVQRIVPAISQLGSLRLLFAGILPNLELLHKELSQQIEGEPEGKVPFGGLGQDIRLKNIWFSYNGSNAVFKGLDLVVRKNKTTAIVGPSGAGKSTVIDLLLRMYPVGKGEMLVDGIKLDSLRKRDWLGSIGFVGQDTFIFNASIRENIKAGKEGATDDEMIRAAELAFADEFIAELPEKYDTIVGERGLKLSGGQRQRIAIARALIREPDIIILDEATSALDSISEKRVKESIYELGKNKTVIMAAHRLTTVQDADYIYVLDDGHIVEEGTHESLFKMRGHYWRLYRTQVESGDRARGVEEESGGRV